MDSKRSWPLSAALNAGLCHPLGEFFQQVCVTVSTAKELNSCSVSSHIVYKSPGMNVPIKFKADKFVMWVGNKWLQTKYGFISYF